MDWQDKHFGAASAAGVVDRGSPTAADGLALATDAVAGCWCGCGVVPVRLLLAAAASVPDAFVDCCAVPTKSSAAVPQQRVRRVHDLIVFK